MNETVGSPRIGQWYLRGDKGEPFLVTGRDDKARTIEIQSFDGDLDEIDENFWSALPLAFAEPPEDWTGPIDAEPDEAGDEDTGIGASEASESLQPIRAEDERDAIDEGVAIDEGEPIDEGLPTDEGAPIAESMAQHPEAAARLR
jgi:hypothetical protein